MAKPVKIVATIKGRKRAKESKGMQRANDLDMQSRARSAVITKAKKDEFLGCFSECGSLLQAATEAAVHRNSHYVWLGDADYRRAFVEAKLKAVDALEARVFQRANVDSDRLAEFLLKGLRPDVYGDRMKSEVSGPGGGPIDIRAQRLESLSDEDLVVVLAMQLKLEGK